MDVVVDTNVFISSLFSPSGKPKRAIVQCIQKQIGIRSERTTSELVYQLGREKFRNQFSDDVLNDLIDLYKADFREVTSISVIRDCRDPKDNKFLELALDGNADIIVSGDQDLLVLHPWRDISILNPSDFLDHLDVA